MIRMGQVSNPQKNRRGIDDTCGSIMQQRTNRQINKNNAKMIIMEHGSKSYIHDWQHDLNMYYKYKHGEFPPLNEGNELC